MKSTSIHYALSGFVLLMVCLAIAGTLIIVAHPQIVDLPARHPVNSLAANGDTTCRDVCRPYYDACYTFCDNDLCCEPYKRCIEECRF